MHHSPNLLTFNHFQVIICFCWGLCVTNKFLFFQGLSCGPSGYFLLHGLERIIRLLLSLGSLLCLGPSPTSERSLIMRLPQWEHKQKISPDAVFICKYMYICETLSIYVYMYVYLYKFMFWFLRRISIFCYLTIGSCLLLTCLLPPSWSAIHTFTPPPETKGQILKIIHRKFGKSFTKPLMLEVPAVWKERPCNSSPMWLMVLDWSCLNFTFQDVSCLIEYPPTTMERPCLFCWQIYLQMLDFASPS